MSIAGPSTSRHACGCRRCGSIARAGVSTQGIAERLSRGQELPDQRRRTAGARRHAAGAFRCRSDRRSGQGGARPGRRQCAKPLPWSSAYNRWVPLSRYPVHPHRAPREQSAERFLAAARPVQDKSDLIGAGLSPFPWAAVSREASAACLHRRETILSVAVDHESKIVENYAIKARAKAAAAFMKRCCRH